MRLLHLSDIHFRTPECMNPSHDPGVPFRSLLEIDLVDLCTKDGTAVDAILVGGDIAFKGHPDEYKVAKDWLLRVAERCGCKPEGILIVPGNHDVDRSICATAAVSNAQQAIANEPELHSRDQQLARQLRDEQTGAALFKPLEAYNDFAAQFGCSIFPKRPFWDKDLVLANDVKLRVFGLTSVLISGHGDRDKEPGRLFLGSAQRADAAAVRTRLHRQGLTAFRSRL